MEKVRPRRTLSVRQTDAVRSRRRGFPLRGAGLSCAIPLLCVLGIAAPATTAAAQEVEDALLAPAEPTAEELQALDRNADGRVDIGDVLYASGATSQNQPPDFAFTPPYAQSVVAGDLVLLSWTDADPDDDASIQLHIADAAGTGASLPFATDLSEDDPRDFYLWDTAELPAGDYAVSALIQDATHAPLRVDYPVILRIEEAGEQPVARPLAHWAMDDEVLGAGQLLLERIGAHHGLTHADSTDCTYASDAGGACRLFADDGGFILAGTPSDVPLGWYRLLDADAGGFSVQARVYLTPWDGARAIVSSAGYELAITAEGLARFRLGAGGSAFVSTRAPLPLERWTLITAVFEPDTAVAGGGAGRLLLYLDGELQAQRLLGVPVTPAATASDLLIGRDVDGGSPFEGLIDDVKLFATPLPPAAVRELAGRFYNDYADAIAPDENGADPVVPPPNLPPTLTLIEPAAAIAGSTRVAIAWTDADSDHDARIRALLHGR
jgi:hypothetical protein